MAWYMLVPDQMAYIQKLGTGAGRQKLKEMHVECVLSAELVGSMNKFFTT